MPHYQLEVLNPSLEKKAATKTMGTKHNYNLGPAPTLSEEEMQAPERHLHEQTARRAWAARGALCQKENLLLDQGAPHTKNLIIK